MQAILWPLLVWIFREVVLKFVLMAVVFVMVAELTPIAAGYVAGFISPGGLTTLFNALPEGSWYFLNVAQLGTGLPLLISAMVSRFLIRRLPFIG